MALCKRLVQSGAHLFKLRLLDATHKSSFFTPGKFEHSRNISELVRSNTPKRAFLVDTLALVRVLESHQVPSKQAETITTAIVAVLNDSLESLSHSCVSKEEMQKSAMIQDSSLSKFKVEVQSSQVAREMIQDSNFSKFQNELQSSLAKFQSELQSNVSKFQSEVQSSQEKLQGDLDKKHSELRYEIDKGIAGQRLDLNLERGRTRDELANQKAETTNLTNKSDRQEIHALRAQVEAAKYEIIKYCIGTLVSISAVGLAVIRILM
ncbi:Protein FMP32, mitochondrial [Linum perenne]